MPVFTIRIIIRYREPHCYGCLDKVLLKIFLNGEI